MPVKIKQPATKSQSEAPNAKGNQLDTATLKQIQKLAIPLAKKASAMKLASENLEKSTFSLYADFRSTCREHFADNPKAGRQLAINVLGTVYDVPITAIRLDGRDQAVFVYPAEYTNAKGKVVGHPKAGQVIDMDDADDATKEIAVHPVVKGAAMLYQRASRLLKVAFPEDDRAKGLVDEALDDDGTCLCSENQLYQLATGASREIEPKGSHGGTRTAKVWDEKALTAEFGKFIDKGWNGGDIISGYKGTLSLEEITEAFAAAISEREGALEKAEKAQAKAAAKAGKGGKASKADDENEE